MKIEDLVRPHIPEMQPYQPARYEFSGEARIFIDANENPFENGFNRYPDPFQNTLRETIARIKGIRKEQLFLGHGSDEAIDLLIRIFCTPGTDRIAFFQPTYGMYRVFADLNAVPCVGLTLDRDFQPRVADLKHADAVKVVFLCSPNNPTGNLPDRQRILDLLDFFEGIVVIDEAYIDFCQAATCVDLLEKYENLVILQTLSKAWGLAGLRVGLALASPKIIQWMFRVKPPYNISSASMRFALERLDQEEAFRREVRLILQERARLAGALKTLPFVRRVYPSDANFLLAEMDDAELIYQKLIQRGIVARRKKIDNDRRCLRFSIGKPEENSILLDILSKIK